MKTLDGGESVGGSGKPVGKKSGSRLFSIVVLVLFLNLSSAHAVPLDVVEVGAPAVNCVFDSSCKLTASDTSSTFALPGMAGLARLQSRTFTGGAGAPAAGRKGYEYRLDLSQVAGGVNIVCVTSITLEFGPVVKNLDYDGNGDADEVFVITSGGLGNVGPTSASLDGNDVTFRFKTPVCAGAFQGDGDSTFFFGLTSARPPRTVVAEVETLDVTGIAVGARAPELPVTLVFKSIQDAIVALPFDSLVGPPALRESRRRALLKRLAVAERAAENDHTRIAIRALEDIAAAVDGAPPDWVVDDPRTETNEPGALLALVREAIDELGGSPRPRPRPRPGARRGSGVRCTVGRYRVEGDPLSSRSGGDGESVLSLIGGRLAIDESCPAVDVTLRDSRAGTLVSARWPRCEGLPHGASLIGVIDDGTCTLFEGAFRAPGSKRKWPRSVKAHLVLCGEPKGSETRIEEADEECDPVDRLAVKFLRWRN